jgi:hypothetical protein
MISGHKKRDISSVVSSIMMPENMLTMYVVIGAWRIIYTGH